MYSPFFYISLTGYFIQMLNLGFRFRLFSDRFRETPRFSTYTFRRSTADDVRRIFGGRGNVEDAMELEDIPFSASDIPDFEEKRAMAAQLDSLLDE